VALFRRPPFRRSPERENRCDSDWSPFLNSARLRIVERYTLPDALGARTIVELTSAKT
jgi:hypothetical protein